MLILLFYSTTQYLSGALKEYLQYDDNDTFHKQHLVFDSALLVKLIIYLFIFIFIILLGNEQVIILQDQTTLIHNKSHEGEESQDQYFYQELKLQHFKLIHLTNTIFTSLGSL